MPNIQSAKKALRKSQKRRERNLKRKEGLKSTIKKYKKLIQAGKKDEAASLLPQVYKTLDKLAKVSFIKKNKASRLKSRLAKKLNPSNSEQNQAESPRTQEGPTS